MAVGKTWWQDHMAEVPSHHTCSPEAREMGAGAQLAFLYSVLEPNPWDGPAHIDGGFPLLNPQ